MNTVPVFVIHSNTTHIQQHKFAAVMSGTFSDVDTHQPDKKSIMMYIMCFFQVLPHQDIVIDEALITPPVSARDNTSKSSNIIAQV